MLIIQFGYSQVGINTTSPNAQLDIKSSNQATPANNDGILIPKIDAFPVINPTAAQNSMMVYLTTISAGKQPGFYYWDNTGTPQWKGISGNSGWQITGNIGTNPATNFIGTIDSVDVVFRRNNTVAGKIGGTSTSLGFESLPALSTGNSNTAIGCQSLNSNTIGFENVAVGKEALFGNNSGSLNTAVGFAALGNSKASNNTAIGGNALVSNFTGESNVAVGVESLYSNFDGINNTALGRDSLHQNSDGQNNTGVGYAAGNLITSGSDNTAVGAYADVPNPTANNQLSIANVIYGTGTNSSLTSKIGINEPAPNAKLQINASSQANPNSTDGIIIPRVSVFPFINPGALQNGMMVFLTAPLAQSGFYYWDNPTTSWKGIGANSGWGLKGNSGTNETINFMGTTDDENIIFKRNNIRAGFIGLSNTSFGNNALAAFIRPSCNSAFGTSALSKCSTSFGFGGNYNCAFGYFALKENVFGESNTAIGTFSLQNNAGTSNNTTLGYATLLNNISGFGNVAIGNEAGYNETGSNKLYIENSNSATPLIYGEFDNDLARINGNFRIKSTTIATAEMQIKNSNLYNHSADNNLNFGTGGGYFMVSTQDVSPSSETTGIRGDGDNVSIWSPGDGNRQLRILDEDQWFDNNGNPYDNGAEVAYIAANGQYFQVSDKNKKENIIRIENAFDKIMKISGYTYQYKLSQPEIEKGQKPVSASGVLAQEIEHILPEAIQTNESGEYFVDYSAITPLLIEAIKEQNVKIKLLETFNSEILKRLEKLEAK